jgi:hypothetical protein
MRDHEPIVIEEFNGLWKRGAAEECPIDHFPDGENFQSVEGGFETRDGLDVLPGPGNVIRMYRYNSPIFGEGLLTLDTNFQIKHAVYNPDQVFTILTLPSSVEDFDFQEFNGRAYITPAEITQNAAGFNSITGLAGEFVYVYKGDGQPARKAAGNSPVNGDLKPFIAFNSQTDGKIDKGVHIFGVSFDDSSSALGPEILPLINAPGLKEAHLINIPIGPVGTTSRAIYATQAIDPKDYDPSNPPTFFLVTVVGDNTTVNISVSFADSELTVPFAAGATSVPSDDGALRVSNTNTDGFNDFGLHLIGVVYETDTGFLTAPGPEFFGAMTYVDIKKAILIENVPISPDSFVTKRHLVSTKAINNYNGDQAGYQFFFIPGGTIEDNVTTSKEVSYYDADLLEDASYLIDNFAEIPAGAGLAIYNGRLALFNTDTDKGIVYLSAPGEPEAIDQVDGILIPPDRTVEIWNAQEFRDVFYVFKNNRTYAYVDNGDVPSTWSEPTPVDQGIGAAPHGIAQVLDSGGVNIEFILVVHFGGLYLFTGTYVKPELSWKIEDLWLGMDDNDFVSIQIMNDSINKRIYISLPNRLMLMADYKNGLDYEKIRWHPWRFDIEVNTIALMNFTQLIIGSAQAL